MEENMEQFTMESGKAVYLYVPQAVKEQAKVRVPMVLFLCGTNCDPVIWQFQQRHGHPFPHSPSPAYGLPPYLFHPV